MSWKLFYSSRQPAGLQGCYRGLPGRGWGQGEGLKDMWVGVGDRERQQEARRVRWPCLLAGWLDSDGGGPRRRPAPVRRGKRAAVSPAARRAWRRRGRAAQTGAPASARTPSPQILRPAPSILSPWRTRATGPRNEATPRATPTTQPPKHQTAARHRDDKLVSREAPAHGPHGSGELSAGALHSGNGSLSAAAQTGFHVKQEFLPDSRAS